MKKKIFIIDDDAGIVEVMTIVLGTDYEVKNVEKFDQLYEDLKLFLPDLIILDLWLRGTEGKQVIQQLRADPVLASIPVLMISAKNNADQVATELKANGFLPKPFDIHELTKKVATLLSS